VSLWDPQTKRKRHVGCYTAEEDAGRAYDRAAVQARGPGAERNFPGETISEPSVAAGEGKQKSSRHLGVSSDAGSSTWHTYARKPQTGEVVRHIGSYASEEDAARAYDWAVHSYGPGAQHNFPDEVPVISAVSSHRCYDAAPVTVIATPSIVAGGGGTEVHCPACSPCMHAARSGEPKSV
jgi:hypothetical protein